MFPVGLQIIVSLFILHIHRFYLRCIPINDIVPHSLGLPVVRPSAAASCCHDWDWRAYSKYAFCEKSYQPPPSHYPP